MEYISNFLCEGSVESFPDLVQPYYFAQIWSNPRDFTTLYTGNYQDRINPAFTKNDIQIQESHINENQGMLNTRTTEQDFVDELCNPSPITTSNLASVDAKTVFATSYQNGNKDANSKMEIDTLMQAIQAKTRTTEPQFTPSFDSDGPVAVTSHQFKLTQKNIQEEANSLKGGKKRHQCSLCSKKFGSASCLKKHIRVHTGEKPYLCTEVGCPVGFAQSQNLKVHIQGHKGVKPHMCDICGKGFGTSSTLKVHKKAIHDKSRPYLCRLNNCSSSFTTLGNFNRHQKLTHADAILVLTTKLIAIKDDIIIPAGDAMGVIY